MRFKDRSWLSDQGKIEITGLRGIKFQGFKVKEEPKVLDSVGGVLWTHNFVTASAENGASTEHVTPVLITRLSVAGLCGGGSAVSVHGGATVYQCQNF